MTNRPPQRLGLLLCAGPGQPGYEPALRLAETALARALEVYLYCIDDGVLGLTDTRLIRLADRGARIYGCAYAAERRNLPLEQGIQYGGLALLSELIAAADRFISFGR